jgi:hypothetical protein
MVWRGRGQRGQRRSPRERGRSSLLRETSIGDHPQHPLKGDEGHEDDCGYSDDSYGPVEVAHDVRYLPGSQRMILPIGR